MPSRKNSCTVCGPTEKHVFRFPKERVRLEKWRNFCNISHNEVLKSYRLCTEHFREADILISSTNRTTLKTTAIPTVYAPNQLRRLEISYPSVYNCIKRQKNSEVLLKTSIVNQFKSILSKNTLHQNAHDVEDTHPASNKIVLTGETTPVKLETSSSNQKSVNEIEVDETSWMAANTSFNSSLTTPDVRNNDAVENVEVTCIEASSCTPEVQIQSRTPTASVITDLPLSNPPQPLPQLVSPIIEKTADNEPNYESQVTPTTKIMSNPSKSRHLRYIADIKTPDLETPRRRRECLKIIRFENKKTNYKMRLLMQENQQLKEENKTLKGLILDLRLQKQNLLSADRSARLLVGD